MDVVDEKWGIDLRGRKMHFEPWPVTIQGNYRQPTKEEIDRVFGISGEAVSETLLYFEECKGDTEELIRLLNEHIIDNRFMADRQINVPVMPPTAMIPRIFPVR